MMDPALQDAQPLTSIPNSTTPSSCVQLLVIQRSTFIGMTTVDRIVNIPSLQRRLAKNGIVPSLVVLLSQCFGTNLVLALATNHTLNTILLVK